MKKENEFLEKALDKMFQMVGFDGWDREFTKQPDWFTQKSWPEKDIKNYKSWFLKEIKKDLKLNKQLAEKEWSYFFLMWGWKQV
jgi:hypothetical protein